ncbi:zinc finger protein 800 isoform X2 [Rhinoderma darwinii]|uniref:zinc finger protein 800 isoform X2 n=1 Tax=Rhinoderma darwinii TaxID=43563 RepID=UPI003F667763
MEKNSITPRKTHYLRNKSKHEMETEETKSPTQKILLTDKCCQTDHHDGSNSEKVVEPGDPSLLQQPVQTSKSGILQIIECFRSGTKQLRLMLLREVDTIFECRSCRSLFRGLPNLITHKQFYCVSKLHVAEDPPNGNNQSQVVTDLLESVYPRANNPEVVIQLEAIQTNQNAVFQIVKPVSEVDLDANNMSESSDIQEEESVPASQPSLTPETVILPSENATVEPTSSFSNEDDPHVPSFVARSVKKASNSNPFLCRVCKKDFNCRRSIRRHIKKVHKKKLEDIKKFIVIQRNTTLSSSKGFSTIIHSTGKSCHICQKSFATKANTRRHIDEVHKGMRRDYITTESNAKPVKNVNSGIVTPKKGVKTISPSKKSFPKSNFSLASSSCPVCNRRYTSKYLLKKHMQIVHKTTQSENNVKSDEHVAITNGKIKLEDSSSSSGTSSPQSESKGATIEKKSASTAKNKTKSDGDSPKTGSSPASDKKKCRKPKLSAGFDFKQLYCKLCKRQFTSKQNLAKHIELHTDGNCIFVKFYRCPLCSYETRRKRDVIRHITVVHKKTQRAVIKITANLESRAVKKPIECIMDNALKKCHKKEKGKKASSKKDGMSSSSSKKNYGGDSGIEVKVTKNFSLLKCKTCGKAFAKKKDLEQHKKNHKVNSNSPADIKNKGRSTRSKTPVS